MGEMESLERHFGTMPEAFALFEVLLDPIKEPYDFRFLYLNKAMAKLLGFDKKNLLGARYYQIFPEGDRKWLTFYYDAAFNRKQHILRKFYSREIKKYLRIICYPWPGANLCACLFLDETDYVKSDKRLYQANQSLQEAKQKLDRAYAEAKKANDDKTELLASVSKGIRTPLDGILGYINLAMEIDRPELLREYMAKIKDSGQMLQKLINKTADLSRIERGEIVLNPEPVSYGLLLRAIFDMMKPAMEAKKIKFVVDTSKAALPNVYMDILRFQDIILNILSNAINFTAENGRIDFIVETLELGEKEVQDRIVIRDTGCGMSKKFLPHLFEPFSQEYKESRARDSGAGLGMSIVKKLVELMGGQIKVNSEPEKGTEFTLYMRTALAPERYVSKKPRKRIDISLDIVEGKKVLLCEDNEVNQELATAILEMQGIEVVCAMDGREGLDIFTKSSLREFAAILLDERMPVMDGLETARRIRELQREDAQEVPILALTGNTYENSVKRAREAGMDAYLLKPFEPGKLLETLAECMVKKHQQDK